MNSYTGYLIYGLEDPISNKIRYVGRSCSGLKRPTEHARPHKLKIKSHTTSWIKSLLNQNQKPKVVVLETFPDPSQLNEAEKKWINIYKNNDLTNHTDGGGGIAGYRHTEEAKRKIGLACKGEKHHNWKGGAKCQDCSKKLGTFNITRCYSCYLAYVRSPEYHLSRSGPNNPSWKGGKPNCLFCGKKLASYTSTYCRKHCYLKRKGFK